MVGVPDLPRNTAAAEKVVAEARATGADATAVRADVAVEADVEAAFAAADAMGPLGGVVVNAGSWRRRPASTR